MSPTTVQQYFEDGSTAESLIAAGAEALASSEEGGISHVTAEKRIQQAQVLATLANAKALTEILHLMNNSIALA